MNIDIDTEETVTIFTAIVKLFKKEDISNDHKDCIKNIVEKINNAIKEQIPTKDAKMNITLTEDELVTLAFALIIFVRSDYSNKEEKELSYSIVHKINEARKNYGI